MHCHVSVVSPALTSPAHVVSSVTCARKALTSTWNLLCVALHAPDDITVGAMTDLRYLFNSTKITPGDAAAVSGRMALHLGLG